MVTIVFTNILLSSKTNNNLHLLAYVILIGLDISWSELSLYPGVVGNDPWWHQSFTLKLVDTGFIPQGEAYSWLAIFHILVGSVSLITGLSYKITSMYSIGLPHTFCISIMIYLISRLIFKDNRIGLLASLLLVTGNYFIYMNTWYIPTTLAASFVPIVIYALFRKSENNGWYLIGILLMVVLILTHSVVSLWFCILIFLMLISSVVYNFLHTQHISIKRLKPLFNYNKIVTLILPILFAIAMLSWWTLVSQHMSILVLLAESQFSQKYFFSDTPQILYQYYANIPLFEQLINNISFLVFFSLSFLGIFYMLSSSGTKLTFTTALLGLLTIFIVFFAVITGSSVIEDRWYYFSQVLLSIPLAVSLLLILSLFKDKLIQLIPLFIIITSFILIMIMSPQANMDNLTFDPYYGVTTSLTESEITSIQFLSQVTTPISTDSYYSRCISTLGYSQLEDIDYAVFNKDYGLLHGNYVVIRDYIQNKPFKLYKITYKMEYNIYEALNLIQLNRVYDSGSVRGYI